MKTSYKATVTWRDHNNIEDNREPILFVAESEEEAIDCVIATYLGEGSDAPAREDISVEDLGHLVTFDCDMCCIDEVELAEAAIKAMPSGYNDPTEDEDHTIVFEPFKYNGHTYYATGTVVNFEPNYSIDEDGNYGYFDVTDITVTSW